MLFDVGGRHDLGGKMKPLTQIIQPFGRQGVVVPLPAELRLEIFARRQRLTRLDHVEVLRVDLLVFREVEVFLRNQHTLCFVDWGEVSVLVGGFGGSGGLED